MSAGVRLSAGSLKGRRLAVPRGVRPTEGRVREALFDILGPRIDGSRFLDLFAGSGAVGIEALSRGAASCVQVDRSRQVVGRLRRAYEALEIEARCVTLELPKDLGKLAAATSARFDFIFADPPYAFDLFPLLLDGLGSLAHLGTVVVVEHDRRRSLPDEAEGWRVDSRRSYGESALSFYAATGRDG